MLEANFQAEVLWLLRKMGCLCVKQKERSMPDYLVVIPGGGSLFIEFKSSTGKLSKLQHRRANRLRSLGATVFVASPNDPWIVVHIMRVCALYSKGSNKSGVLNDIADLAFEYDEFKLVWGTSFKEFLIIEAGAVTRNEVGVAGVKHVLFRLWEKE